MEITTIVDFITQLGFPIACVAVLFWFIYQLQQDSKAREERLMLIVENYGNKLTEITNTINAINDKIDKFHSSDKN